LAVFPVLGLLLVAGHPCVGTSAPDRAESPEFRQLPSGAAGDWLLAFIDIETTGLLPGYHEMVDIGVVLSDLEGVETGRFFTRIMPEHPERVSTRAVEVNGFDVGRWKESGASAPAEAVQRLQEFYESKAGGKNVLMVAQNVSFDAAFLDWLFRSVHGQPCDLHRFALDLPSMAWGAGIRGVYGRNLRHVLGVEDEPRVPVSKPWEHTGLTGAEVNLRVYRALLALRADPRE
jgi:hypothetical protein